MKAFYILFLFLLFSCKSGKDVSTFSYAELSPELTELVKLLVETDYIGTQSIGRSNEPSVAYANREALLSIASEDELILLINHPEGEVAATAFEGLVRKNYSDLDLKEELLNLSKGDRLLSYLKGDVVFVMPALEYSYVIILGNELDGNFSENTIVNIGLSEAEKAFVENRIMAIRQTM
ncbi:hypothetical protein O3Q51_11870 [Cryomorphaceae bacterium 1068]|nr:hypothetical protein [Cryomorphaceae bacterium 1068]